MTEFNLSEKINKRWRDSKLKQQSHYYLEEDVKEFIKREDKILEELRDDKRPLTREGVLALFQIRRNKLAGKELV